MIRTAVPTPRPVRQGPTFKPADVQNRTIVRLRDGRTALLCWVAADGSTVRVQLPNGTERLEQAPKLERVVGRYRVS